MLLSLMGFAALFFGWRAITRRLDNIEREVQALKAHVTLIETRLAPPPASVTPPRPTFATPPLPALPAAQERESLEAIIGSRWLLYIGVFAVIVGVSYFVKLAFDNHWINETARVVIGAITGVALVLGGMRFVRSGYGPYGQSISGGGIAILYLSIYAGFNFYHLIPQPPAFILMCLVTVAAAWIADRQRSQPLALLAIGGGFATPFFLATGHDAEVALFTYDAILVLGTTLLARRQQWSWLILLSYVGVVLTVTFWTDRFYTSDKFLATEAFLTLFCVLFLYLLYELRASVDPMAQNVRRLLWSAPVLYYVSSLAVLYEHGVALLIYLTLLHVIGVAAATKMARASLVRLISWAAATIPLADWIARHSTAGWFVPALGVAGGLYAITLAAQVDDISRHNRRLDDTDLGLVHASALGVYGCVYLLLDAIHPFAAAPVALGFAVWQVAIAGWFAPRNRSTALHFIGIAFTLTSIAIAIQFHGAGAVIGWAAEGAAAIWLGLRERRGWLRAGGGVLLTMSIVALIALQFESPYSGQLVFINRRALAGGFVIAVLVGLAELYRRAPSDRLGEVPVRDVLIVAANALAILVLTTEVVAFWKLREPFLTSRESLRSARLSREAMISILWAVYATGLIMAGLRRHYTPIRYLAIVVFGLTVIKVFAVDLASLDRLYRVASVIGLGVLLLVASYLYQRARAVPKA